MSSRTSGGPEATNLLHDFVPCSLPECKIESEHCGYEWCGAPKNHSLHTCAAQPVETAKPESEKEGEL